MEKNSCIFISFRIQTTLIINVYHVHILYKYSAYYIIRFDSILLIYSQ